MIPYAHQEITEQDIEAVKAVLNSDFLTQGPAVPLFESTVANYCGAKFAVAVNSATSALHIACMALGLKRGDLLWTTPITFVASANCGVYCGADVDFVDINPKTWNLDIDILEQKLKLNARQGRLPDVLVAVHFAGQSCDMERIHSLSRQYGFRVIEDASHAIGGRYKNSKIGSCRYSDITVFSFHPVKIITTGEGGMALTNDSDIAESLRIYRSHGISRDVKCMTRPNEGGWYYEQIGIGYNYRMTDIQAALGTSQMQRLDNYVSIRNTLFDRYKNALNDLPLQLPYIEYYNRSAIHLYPVMIESDKVGKTRRQVYDELISHNIHANVHYIPVHTQPFYMNYFGFKKGDFPNAEHYYSTCVSLPMYATLSQEKQNCVISALHDILAV